MFEIWRLRWSCSRRPSRWVLTVVTLQFFVLMFYVMLMHFPSFDDVHHINPIEAPTPRLAVKLLNKKLQIKQNPLSSGARFGFINGQQSEWRQRKAARNAGRVWPVTLKLPAKINNITSGILSRNVVTPPENAKRVLSTQASNLFAVFSHPAWASVELKYDDTTYFREHQNLSCLAEGSMFPGMQEETGSRCHCKSGWHGHRCSIPEAVIQSDASAYVPAIRVRTVPRRVVNALAFNAEFELLEARLHELNGLVDMFVILESNYSNHGDAKPLRLLERLRQGYLKKFHKCITHVMMPFFPRGGRENGWIIDQQQRTYISKETLSRIDNLNADDLFMYNDADEIPSRQSLIFLKLHDGFPEPVGLSLRWSVFTFYWRQMEPTRVMAACTVGMLRSVFQGDAYLLRTNNLQSEAGRGTGEDGADDEELTGSMAVQAYVKEGGLVRDWYLADSGGHAGWHCSWCMPPEGVQIKLTSAINADFPRWGDYPEKLRLSYIRGLIRTGTWFDNETQFEYIGPEDDAYFAPQYVMRHRQTYEHLLEKHHLR